LYKRGTPEYDRWKASPAYKLFCKRISVANKGKRNPNYGKHHSAKTRKKMRELWTLKRRQMQSKAQEGKQNSFYGEHHSAGTRAKISVASSGEHNPMYGKHHSEETRAKMRVANTGKHHSAEALAKMSLAMTGERHPNWRGGVSFEPYPTGWTMRLRDTIRKRDNYTCVLCGKPQNKRQHSVHHINYDKEDLRSKNLVTLCRFCHHKTNHDRKYWENLFLMIYVPDFPKIRRKNESKS